MKKLSFLLLLVPRLALGGVTISLGNGQNQVIISSGNGQNQAKVSKSWPFGRDGAWNLNGQTVHITAGTVKDYSSCNIINSVIIIDGTTTGTGDDGSHGGAWTVIGCAGNLTMTGSTWYGQTGGDAFHSDSSYPTEFITKTAPDGTALSFGVQNYDGGVGGSDACSNSDQSSGQYGNGGPGSSGNANTWITATAIQAGTGGVGNGTPSVGDGALIFGSDGGTAGDDPTSCGTSFCAIGGGGGGGSRGLGGQFLYLKVAGNVTYNTSSFVFSGLSGGKGGNGGDTPVTTVYGDPGGGGSGGAGGEGGAVLIKIHGTGTIDSATIDVTGGTKGLNGGGGATSTQICGGPGSNGGDSADGRVGTKSVASY